MNDQQKHAERDRHADNLCNHGHRHSHRTCTTTPGGHGQECNGQCDWCLLESTARKPRR